jgi:hypothetical protein
MSCAAASAIKAISRSGDKWKTTHRAIKDHSQTLGRKNFTACVSHQALSECVGGTQPHPKNTLIKVHDISPKLNSSRASKVKVVKKPCSRC